MKLFCPFVYLQLISVAISWTSPQQLSNTQTPRTFSTASFSTELPASSPSSPTSSVDHTSSASTTLASFDSFVSFLEAKQNEIIQQLEELEAGSASFSNDPWGIYHNDDDADTTSKTTTVGASSQQSPTTSSGGRTRVIQKGSVIEKGACSLTVLRKGTLSPERARAIRSRQVDDDTATNTTTTPVVIAAGSCYYAAALSMVLHSRSPMVPTFRSDVRLFAVETSNGDMLAWFGGGADLTPYYLIDEDVSYFHKLYKDLCDSHELGDNFDYASMKKACDKYFFLPARQEHRGTGGIFYDDLMLSDESTVFTQGVVDIWMQSWIPIVQKRNNLVYTEEEKYWQMLRRGRYLEFNLLYDRGVQFGLANANPRVEGVMVSAPPQIAFEYNHVPAKESREEALMVVLKSPRDWI